MVTTPAAIPFTTPVDVPTVATDVLLLVQVPPPVASNNGVVEPGQTVITPVMPAGVRLTVAVALIKQPVGNV